MHQRNGQTGSSHARSLNALVVGGGAFEQLKLLLEGFRIPLPSSLLVEENRSN